MEEHPRARPRASDRGRALARAGPFQRLGLFIAGTIGTVAALSAVAAITTEAGAAPSPLGPGDAEAGAPCTFVATGAVTTSGSCKVRMFHFAPDASPAIDGFSITADSAKLWSIHTFIHFKGGPHSGVIRPPMGAAWIPYAGTGSAKGNGVEWTAAVGMRGTFDLNLTSIRSIPVDGGTSYDLHGDLEIEMPASNSKTQRPLTLLLSF